MPTFNFPTSVRPAEIRWQLISNSQGFASPLNGIEQTAELPGTKWMASLTFANLKRSEIAVLEAFIAQLRGRASRALLWHHLRENPRGSNLGTPLVAGASQPTGNSINTDGWTLAESGLLLIGDHIGINGELKIVTGADVDSDVGGAATIQFEPPLRYSPPDNSLIVTTKATAKMMLVDDGQGRVTSRRSLNGTTLTFIEDIA